jgi:hypothetical protein
MKTNKKHIPIIILFFVVLVLPIVQQCTGLFTDMQVVEKRELAGMPEFAEVGLVGFPRAFDAYYNDNFGFRGTVISANGYGLDKLFDVSPSDRVVIGSDDWLFFNNRQSLVDFEGRIQYSEDELSAGVRGLVRNWRELQKRGITYLFVIAPDKSTIYPEFMPEHLQKKHAVANSRLDQLLGALLAEYPDFPVLDLRGALFDAKEREMIYHKRDTHWNTRGAYVGYVEIMKWLCVRHPELGFTPREYLVEGERRRTDADLSKYINVHTEYTDYYLERRWKNFEEVNLLAEEEVLHKAQRFVGEEGMPRLLMYKDSFTVNMVDFISQHFSESLYIHEFPCYVDLRLIDSKKPDIVVHESIERGLHDIVRLCIGEMLK